MQSGPHSDSERKERLIVFWKLHLKKFNTFHGNSVKGKNPRLNALWILWTGLLISCLGIFLISVWLTESLTLFMGREGKNEGLVMGLMGFVILIVGITVIVSVALKDMNKGK